MKRPYSALAASFLLASATSLAAVPPPPDYDAFAEPSRSFPLQTGAARGYVAHSEPRLGVPTVFFAEHRAGGTSLASKGLTPVEAARRHLFEHAALYRQAPSAHGEAELLAVHDTGRGAIIASFNKRVDGLPVFRDALHVVMDRALNLVALTGYLTPHEGAKKGLRWNLTRQTVLAAAFTDLTGQQSAPSEFADLNQPRHGYEQFVHAPTRPLLEGQFRVNGVSRIKQVMFSLPDGLVPAYYLELDAGSQRSRDAFVYSYVISAVDGALLFRRNLTDADAFNYRVWADGSGWNVPQDGPQGTVGTPHPDGVPNGYQAPFIAPNLISVAALPFSHAATDPWLPAGATTLTGNNVEAYADLAAGDGFTANTADVRGTSTGVGSNGLIEFGDLYDVTQDPAATPAQINAAVTQLFFDNNFFHDWFYDHGFDELAGNAQASNYGRGGKENDSLKVEGQDYGGSNNANMSTPADGGRPRMQMYIFTGNALSYLGVVAPASIAGNKSVGTAGFGATAFDLTAEVVYPLDSGDPAASVAPGHTGCYPFPSAHTGKIILVDRGSCTFVTKATNAQAAGAVGVLIANNTTGTENMSGTMSGSTFAVLSVTQADGTDLKGAISSGTVTARMYREQAIRRDGMLDNTIVAHEWAHYLTNRLVGDSSGLSNQQGRSLGEGWADFNALLMSVRDSDRGLLSNVSFSGAYAAAPYVTSGGANNGYFYGTRRVTYSTDFSKNGLTFKMIENGVPLVPIGSNPPFPVRSGQSGTNNSEFHNSGEVWCTLLWEGFVELLNATSRYSFAQAQDAMKDYLVASLKVTPNAPTMLEARDALLAVVYASNKQDFALFTGAFARRGAGIGASAPDRFSTTHVPTVQTFAGGGDLRQTSATLNDDAAWCDHDGTLDDGETGNLVLNVQNTGWVTLAQLQATVTTTTPGVTMGNGGKALFAAVEPYAAQAVIIPVTLSGVSGATPIALTVSYSDPSFPAGAKVEQLAFLTNFDQALGVSAMDDVETPTVAWTFANDPALSVAQSFGRVELGVSDHALYAPNPSAPADLYLVSPPLNVAATGAFSFTFQHAFEFEANSTVFFDGAIVELSADAGLTWTKIPQSALSGQMYNATLAAGGSNPLAGQLAFGGASPGFPAKVTTTANLGTTYAGQTVQVRFRVGGDDNTARRGWYIDDVAFTGITNTPFHQVVTDTKTCVNRPPVAKVGADQVVDERTSVTLDGSMSSDVDGDPLTFLWSQTGGPAVTFTGTGTFVAPEVSSDTALTFALSVSDGQLVGGPATTQVLVRQVNRAPTAVVADPFVADERAAVILEGANSFDVDGDPLVAYQWVQVGGPSVTLSDATAQAPTFIAPEVQVDTAVVLELSVSDGMLQSPPASVEITVRQINRAPTVSIFAPEVADERTLVTLAGLAKDPDGEEPGLLYVWAQTGGPAAMLTSDGGTLTLVAPEVKADTALTFTLRVWDGDEAREDRLFGEADVSLTVREVNRAPVARAGGDRAVSAGEVVTLSSLSTDEDEQVLTHSWTQVAGPEVTLLRASTRYPRFTVPREVAIGTELGFELAVSDGSASSTDRIVVTVEKGATAGGCGCSAGSGVQGAGVLFAFVALSLYARRRRS